MGFSSIDAYRWAFLVTHHPPKDADPTATE
jgi:hypothetical protein